MPIGLETYTREYPEVSEITVGGAYTAQIPPARATYIQSSVGAVIE